MWLKPNTDVGDVSSIWEYALTVDGYAAAFEKFGFVFMQYQRWWEEKYAYYDRTGLWEGSFEELRLCLFSSKEMKGLQTQGKPKVKP